MIRRWLEHPWFAPICLTFGIGLRLLWIFAIRSQPVMDFDWYYWRATDWAAGQGYSIDGRPTAFWPMGYPAFLALIFKMFGPSILAGKLANLPLSAAAIWATRVVARRLSGSVAAANSAMLLMAIHPNSIAHTSLLASETAWIALTLGAIAMLISERGNITKSIFAGVLIGLATLVKPQAFPVPLVIAIWLGWGTAGARPTIGSILRTLTYCYAVAVLVLLPWTVRNYRLSGKIIPVSTNGGFNLLVGNNPYATGSYAWTEPMQKYLGVAWSYNKTAVAEEAEFDRLMRRKAWEFIRQNPLAVLRVIPKKLSALYLGDVDGFYYQGTPDYRTYQVAGRMRGWYWVLAVVGQLFYMGVWALAVGSVIRGVARGFIRSQSLPLFMIAYYTSFYILFFGIMRFHLPVMPWIFMLAGGWAETFGKAVVGYQNKGKPDIHLCKDA